VRSLAVTCDATTSLSSRAREQVKRLPTSLRRIADVCWSYPKVFSTAGPVRYLSLLPSMPQPQTGSSRASISVRMARPCSGMPATLARRASSQSGAMLLTAPAGSDAAEGQELGVDGMGEGNLFPNAGVDRRNAPHIYSGATPLLMLLNRLPCAPGAAQKPAGRDAFQRSCGLSRPEDEDRSRVRICGAPHIHSYVSGVDMWRQSLRSPRNHALPARAPDRPQPSHRLRGACRDLSGTHHAPRAE
jgi:hypothetical protein